MRRRRRTSILIFVTKAAQLFLALLASWPVPAGAQAFAVPLAARPIVPLVTAAPIPALGVAVPFASVSLAAPLPLPYVAVAAVPLASRALGAAPVASFAAEASNEPDPGRAAFDGAKAERERSLREDLRPVALSGQGFVVTPKAIAKPDTSSPVYGDMLKPWDLSRMAVARAPVPIGKIEDKAAFSKPTVSVLNMPIKMPGTDFRIPAELEQFREFIQKMIDHEAAVNPDMDGYYAYLTVDQNEVKAGATQRRPGVHIDGVQGARYKTKIVPEHLYSVSDALGTVFYPQSFDMSAVDPAKHHVHAELERQADESRAIRAADHEIYFWDSYSAHRADIATQDLTRTFVRVEFSKKVYDASGDTVSPLFEYDWKRVDRPIPADLDDAPRRPEGVDAQGYAREVASIPAWPAHTVKNLKGYLTDNLGAETVAAAKAGTASFLITVGEGREALAAAEAKGWKIGKQIAKKEGFHRVFEARTPVGRRGFVLQRVNGEDRVLHVQSLLKLAGASARRVRTIGASVSMRERYKKAFAKLGYVPDLVVYGFANTAIDAALLRNGFKNGRHFATLRRNYAKKLAALSGGDAAADDLDGMNMQVLGLADGRKVWFLHCMFGDLARDLVGAVADHGAKNIAFIGSAGSLDADGRMGEVVIPAVLRRPDGSEEALDFLPVIPGVPRRGVYARVPTPNVGTKAWADATRAAGVNLIESELALVLGELRGRPGVRVQASLVVTEAVYGPDGRDMTEWNLKDLRALIPALQRILDAALGATKDDWIVKSYTSVPLGD